jgi:hypothetical protein
VSTTATPAATSAAEAAFFATSFSFDRVFGIVMLAGALACVAERFLLVVIPFVARLDLALGLACAAFAEPRFDLRFVSFAAVLALVRLDGFFMLSSQ